MVTKLENFDIKNLQFGKAVTKKSGGLCYKSIPISILREGKSEDLYLETD